MSRCENIELVVHMRLLYKGRDGGRFAEFEAVKRFSRPFIPQIGSTICAVRDEDGMYGHFIARVSEVRWRSYANADAVIVFTETQVFSDGDVEVKHYEHAAMLTIDRWSCKDIR
jgi:hypothetical protein